MQEKLGFMEGKFADLIWEKAPIRTNDLTKLCLDVFGWKRTTTYTMLKRLCQRGIFENDNGTVVIQMSREAFYGKQSEQFVAETFGGSLPAFIAAFTREKTLSEEEANEIQQLIDQSRSQRERQGNKKSKEETL